MLGRVCYDKESGCRKLCLISLRVLLHVMQQMIRSGVTSDVAELEIQSEVLGVE
jgi:hypothetical protein